MSASRDVVLFVLCDDDDDDSSENRCLATWAKKLQLCSKTHRTLNAMVCMSSIENCTKALIGETATS